MKKIIYLFTFIILALFSFNNFINSKVGTSTEKNLSELYHIKNVSASSTCSVECSGGGEVSLTCDYSCRASTSQQKVICFDQAYNIVDEESC